MKSFKFLPVLIAVIALSACDNKRNSASSSRGLRSGAGITTNAGVGLSAAQMQTPLTVNSSGGRYISGFTNVTSADTAFQDRVKIMMSSLIDPIQVGNVAATGGVKFSVYVDTNSLGQFVMANSRMNLIVTDDQVGKVGSDGQTIQAIGIAFNLLDGYLNSSTGEIQLVFRDASSSSLEVTLAGTYTASTFTGKLKYKTLQSVSTGYTQYVSQQYDLGTFSTSICSVFLCSQ